MIIRAKIENIALSSLFYVFYVKVNCHDLPRLWVVVGLWLRK